MEADLREEIKRELLAEAKKEMQRVLQQEREKHAQEKQLLEDQRIAETRELTAALKEANRQASRPSPDTLLQSVEGSAPPLDSRPSKGKERSVSFFGLIDDDLPSPTSRRNASKPPPERYETPFGSPAPARPRIERIPNLEEKLSDGTSYRVSHWEARVLNNLECYHGYFAGERSRKFYVLDQTEGTAREYLSPLVLDKYNTMSAEDVVQELVDFLSDPAEAQQAEVDFKKLEMGPRDNFWEFHLEFSRLASLAGIRTDKHLRDALREKLPSKIRTRLHLEWARTTTYREYLTAVQQESTGQAAEDEYFSPASRRRQGVPQNRQGNTYSAAKESRTTFQARTSSGPPEKSQFSSPSPLRSGSNYPQRSATPSAGKPSFTSSSKTPECSMSREPRHFNQSINEVDVSFDGEPPSNFDDAPEKPSADSEERLTPDSRGNAAA
jgi:hypothetical protein